jgi:hypothetical protein
MKTIATNGVSGISIAPALVLAMSTACLKAKDFFSHAKRCNG